MKLKDKVALVTGGNGGLGAVIVRKMIEEGAKVAFCGRNEEKIRQVEKELLEMGGDVLGIRCDISSSADVKVMFQKVIEKYGTLDILVNNAGMARRVHEDRDRYLEISTNPGPKYSLDITRNMSDEEWEASIQVNLNSVFYCSREALQIMEPKKYGRIINVASIAGVSNKSPHSPNYAAAKGGVVAFTRSLAAEVGPSGILVNAIAPSFVQGDYFDSFLQSAPDMVARLVMGAPLNRMSTPEEQAAVVCFLSSDEASFITGQCIHVNGGLF